MNADIAGEVLLVVPDQPDYLAVTLLHGLRSDLGPRAIDYPRCDVAYTDFPISTRGSVYGQGFSTFFLLPEVPIDRTSVTLKIAAGKFKLIIFTNIWRTYGLFLQWRQWLLPQNCILLDGEDTPQVYLNAGLWWRKPYGWFLPTATQGFLYFKREWTEDSKFNMWHRLLPRQVRRVLPHYKGLRSISFSIPEEKVIHTIPVKSKNFARHIVDPEVASKVPGSSTSYAFSSEAEYYADLQSARFGITTKRAGWDCLRHYEIAANGTVPCFRDLHLKPETCAPHGLRPGVNCICYRDANELLAKVGALSNDEYSRLAEGALQWARMNTSVQRASQVLDIWMESLK